jgi:hypothetical protein
MPDGLRQQPRMAVGWQHTEELTNSTDDTTYLTAVGTVAGHGSWLPHRMRQMHR